MVNRTREVRVAVRKALEAAGATDLSYSTCGSSHQRYDFCVGATEGRFVFACSPGSSGAVSKAAALAKRAVREYREGRRGGAYKGADGAEVRRAAGQRAS